MNTLASVETIDWKFSSVQKTKRCRDEHLHRPRDLERPFCRWSPGWKDSVDL